MKRHLNWPEDNRICHMPDGFDNCPGCCLEYSPIERYNVKWECIWKKGHTGPHSDYWCCEWDENGLFKRTDEIKAALLEFGLNNAGVEQWLTRPISESLPFVIMENNETPQQMIDDGCSFTVLICLQNLSVCKYCTTADNRLTYHPSGDQCGDPSTL